MHFKSIYAIRLYELLKKEANIVQRYQKTSEFHKEFKLSFLREAFGIEDTQYSKINDFKRFTIEPAKREINEKTELQISEVMYGKTGRAISRITFHVTVMAMDDDDDNSCSGQAKPDTFI